MLDPDTPIRAAAGALGRDVLSIPEGLDEAFPGLRATPQECAEALDMLAEGRAERARDVLAAFPPDRRRMVLNGLAWMAKLGLIDWLD